MFTDWPPLRPKPQYNTVYTVRELYDDQFNGLRGIRFYELRGEMLNIDGNIVEGGYHRDEFRPICTRPTDISIFKKILQPELV